MRVFGGEAADLPYVIAGGMSILAERLYACASYLYIGIVQHASDPVQCNLSRVLLQPEHASTPHSYLVRGQHF